MRFGINYGLGSNKLGFMAGAPGSSVQTVNSVQAAAYNASISQGGPAEWQLPGVINATVRCMVDSYTPAGTEASGSIIRMFSDGVNQTLTKLGLAGANVLWFDLVMGGTTSSLTFSIGDRNSATRYVSASTGAASAGITRVTGCNTTTGLAYVIGTNANTAAFGAETNGDDQIIITTGGATLSATTSVFTLMMFFTWAG